MAVTPEKIKRVVKPKTIYVLLSSGTPKEAVQGIASSIDEVIAHVEKGGAIHKHVLPVKRRAA